MLPAHLPTQIMLFALLLAWLGACVVFDLRSRQVPAWLTIPPLLLAALWRLFSGRLAGGVAGYCPDLDLGSALG